MNVRRNEVLACPERGHPGRRCRRHGGAVARRASLSRGAGPETLTLDGTAAWLSGSSLPWVRLEAEAVGGPPSLLTAAASATVQAWAVGTTTTFAYDATGNRVTETGLVEVVTYTSDPANRLLVVADAEASEQYSYNAAGVRQRKVTAAGTTHYVWDGPNLLAELDGELATHAQQTDLPGQWGGLSSRHTAEGSEFYVADLSTHTRAVLDEAAAPEEEHLYTAFGTDETGESADQPFQFGGGSGYQSDGGGRLYVRARHYDSERALWLSRDPVGGSAMGDYRYVRNGPVGSIDPSGHLGESCGGDAPPHNSCKDWCGRPETQTRPATMPRHPQRISRDPQLEPSTGDKVLHDTFVRMCADPNATPRDLRWLLRRLPGGGIDDEEWPLFRKYLCNWVSALGSSETLESGDVYSMSPQIRSQCDLQLQCMQRYFAGKLSSGAMKPGDSEQVIGCWKGGGGHHGS